MIFLRNFEKVDIVNKTCRLPLLEFLIEKNENNKNKIAMGRVFFFVRPPTLHKPTFPEQP